MEKLSVSKEFVLAAHKAACDDWKSKIEKEFPGLFKPKHEKGKWYFNNGCHLINFSQYGSGNYGINGVDDWHENMHFHKNDDTRLATKEEIEKHLIALAEKKGFNPSTKIHSLGGARNQIIGGISWNYLDGDMLRANGDALVYCSGEWAEIIEEPKTYTFINHCDSTEISFKSTSIE